MSIRWAPWWAYVVVVIGLNQLRQVLVEPGQSTVVDVALAAAAVLVGVVVVTAIHHVLVAPDAKVRSGREDGPREDR